MKYICCTSCVGLLRGELKCSDLLVSFAVWWCGNRRTMLVIATYTTDKAVCHDHFFFFFSLCVDNYCCEGWYFAEWSLLVIASLRDLTSYMLKSCFSKNCCPIGCEAVLFLSWNVSQMRLLFPVAMAACQMTVHCK
jgi:hypothetical protein